jgi:hypothetical protein
MSNIVELPIAVRPITESEIAELHSKAFRDLEGGICDCVHMSDIAAQLMSNAHLEEKDMAVGFAVRHLDEMLRHLQKDYYARWHGEKKGLWNC